MNDADLLLHVGFSTAKMEKEAQKIRKQAEKAGEDFAKAYNGGSAKVLNSEAIKAHTREIDKLKRQYDPLYAASKRYERELAKLNRAHKIGAINSKQHKEQLKRLNAELEQGALRAQRQGNVLSRGAGSARQYGGVMQNVGWQVGDFATQVGAGTSATQALGQQLPQLLGAFGAFGAVAGAGAAILIPLTAALYETVTGSVDLEEQLDALTKTTDAYTAAAEAAETPIETLREKYGDLADEVVRANEAQKAITGTLAEAALKKSAGALSQAFGASIAPGAELFSAEYDRSIATLEDMLGATSGQASSLLSVLYRLENVSGPEQLVKDLVELRKIIEEATKGDPEKLVGVEGILKSIDKLDEAARKQVTSGIDDEERRVNKLFNTYTERTRELTRLTEDRALAERELRKAQTEGNLERADQAKQVIAGIDEEIEKLTDAKGRLEDLTAEAELAQRGFERIAFDPDDESLNAAKDLVEEIRKAVLNVDDLNESDLARLEKELAAIEGRLKEITEAANGAGGALSVAAQDAYAEYAQSRTTGANMSRNAVSGSAIDTIKQFEGYRAEPYWDVNAYRAGFGSDTVTLADGSVRRITQGMRVSIEDANRDLVRRVGEFQDGVIGQIGRDRFNSFTEAQKASLTSIAYNYGSLPERILPAVRGGTNQDIATAIGRLQSDNGGVNRGRRLQEASAFGNTKLAQAEGAQASERQKQLEKEVKERQKLLDVRLQYSDLLQTRVADAEFESSLVGKSAEEQVRLRAEYMLTQEAKRRGIDLNEQVAGSEETYGEAIKRTAAALAQQSKEQETLRLRQDQTSQSAQFFDQIQSTLQNGLVDAIVSGQNFADVLGNVAQMLFKASLQAALFGQGPMAGLFGQTPGIGLLSGLFWDGGYTGDGGKYEPKGVVHGGEYVFSAEAVKRIGVPQLESLHKNLRGYSSGGFVGAGVPAVAQAAQPAPTVATKIVNVLDPALVGDFLATPDGEKLVVNVMRRNGDLLNA